jgi:hypothetical protein
MIAQGEKVLKTAREKHQDTKSEQPARITTSTIPHMIYGCPDYLSDGGIRKSSQSRLVLASSRIDPIDDP